jgi:hypothetical protein
MILEQYIDVLNAEYKLDSTTEHTFVRFLEAKYSSDYDVAHNKNVVHLF